MEDVTDTTFRETLLRISDAGCLNVLFSEFTSTDGMCHEEGRKSVGKRLFVNTSERELLKELNVRIVAQIWGSDPEKFYRVARILSEEHDFDGIDINMGCPVRKIVKQHSCSALINEPELALEIIRATREGSKVAVSVKTRIGFNKAVTAEWTGKLLEAQPDAIILHGRTQKMQSTGEADWNEIASAVKVRDASGASTLIIGNGDVVSMEDGLDRTRASGCDGFMVGRGIFRNPWLFRRGHQEPDVPERLGVLLFHLDMFDKTWAGERNFPILKRFFKIYLHSFPGAAELRAALMNAHDADEARSLIAASGFSVLSVRT
jgi:tRNA-dihydrouridine synthase